MFISIIIPFYNEKDVLEKNIKDIYNFFLNKYKFEIIVVDDGSDDNSYSIFKSLNLNNLKVFRNKVNMGKGYSIVKGVDNSIGDLMLITDADLSAPINEFEKLYLKYNEGYKFVIGSRSKKNSNIDLKQSLIRIFLGKVFNLFVFLILGLKYQDTQCGFKLFDGKKIKSITHLCRVKRFCIDVEILYLAKINNIETFEEGIIWKDNSNSSVKLLRDPFNMLFIP